MNEKQGVVFAEPKTAAEREAIANSCVRNLKIDLPALLDTMDNATERAYTGWPDRLYVIDKYGRVAYKSAPGPYGFRPREMADALIRATSE